MRSPSFSRDGSSRTTINSPFPGRLLAGNFSEEQELQR